MAIILTMEEKARKDEITRRANEIGKPHTDPSVNGNRRYSVLVDEGEEEYFPLLPGASMRPVFEITWMHLLFINLR